MELPVRIGSRSREPVISVDGAWDAPGLNLSHWPGNRTPPELRHDLSSGCALAFARLPAPRRAELARGCTAIENNHFDTDGSCALFAVRHPGRALPRAERLLRAAAAGDFFEWPDDDALRVDAIVHALVDSPLSPLASAFQGLDADARHQRATDFLMDELPAILDGDFARYRELWSATLEDARADRADLATCERDDVAHLDWRVWTAPAGRRSSRAEVAASFDPGRHALFADGAADRVLVCGALDGGATFRFVVGTKSWFDMPSRERAPRPDLEALARRLNELDGTDPTDAREDACAWRFQDPGSQTPELWFGVRAHEPYAEHCPALRPSRLAPARVRREIAEALRAALVLPA